MAKEFAYIFDIDGTLCDLSKRRHYVQSEPKNWKAFFAGIRFDAPKKDVIRIAQEMDCLGYTILLVSGRGEEHREATVDWLCDHDVPLDDLMMRPEKDYRSDTIIKREIYERDIEPYYNVLGVFDDRDSVVAMWRELGLTCFQVDYGSF